MYEYVSDVELNGQIKDWVEGVKADGGLDCPDTPLKRLAYACYGIRKHTRLARQIVPSLSDTPVAKKEMMIAVTKRVPSALNAQRRLYNFVVRYSNRHPISRQHPRHILGSMAAEDLVFILAFLGNWKGSAKIWSMPSRNLSICYSAGSYGGATDTAAFYRQTFVEQYPLNRTTGIMRLVNLSSNRSYEAHLDMILFSFASPIHAPNDASFLAHRIVPIPAIIQTPSNIGTTLEVCQNFMKQALELRARRQR